MQTRTKRVILGFAGLLLLAVLSFFLYFYIQLRGSPLAERRERNEVVAHFESKYGEDFRVVRSFYDYKRNEYFFDLEPASQPDYRFGTSLNELKRQDDYAAVRAIQQIRGAAIAAGLDRGSADKLEYDLRFYEDCRDGGCLEGDVGERLRLNRYVVTITWDVATLDRAAIDREAAAMAAKITPLIDFPVGELELRVSVYDGADYHFADQKLLVGGTAP